MSSLKATAIWILYSLSVAALAHPDSTLKSLSRPLPNGMEAKGLHRRVPETCNGDCVTCFGAGYRLCPSSSSICYLPGDSLHGEESCTGIGSIDIDIPSVPEFCSEGGCEVCFGSGYQLCPDSSINCYKPGDTSYGIASCSSGSSSGSGSSGSGSSGSDSSESASSIASTTYYDDEDTSFSTDYYESTSTSSSTSYGSSVTFSTTIESETSDAFTSEVSSSAAGGIAGGSAVSTTSTASGTSSTATGSNGAQGAAATSDSNGDPISNSNGYSVVREGLVGVLVAGGVAFAAAWHFGM